MHELGLCGEIVDSLADLMQENHLTKIKSVTLRLGEETAVVPRFMMECWPAVIEDSPLKDCKLIIETVTATGQCHNCDTVFNLKENHLKCPICGCEDYDTITGFEYEISEILAE